MPPPTDFSSAQYWSERFITESSFEWLISTEQLIPLILQTLEEVVRTRVRARTHKVASGQKEQKREQRDARQIWLLHLGAGTSALGPELDRYLSSNPLIDPEEGEVPISVTDTDYVLPPSRSAFISKDNTSNTSNVSITSSNTISTEKAQTDSAVPFIITDLLSPSSLITSSPPEGWDLLIDKSTADAISCSAPLPLLPDPYSQAPIDAVERLLFSLAKVTRSGARWVSISYSEKRYDFLRSDGRGKEEDDEEGGGGRKDGYGWKVVRKTMIATTYIPGGRRVREGNEERVVYEPETGVWAYILERI